MTKKDDEEKDRRVNDFDTCLSITMVNGKDDSIVNLFNKSNLESGLATINDKKDWIINSRPSHHITRNGSCRSKWVH